MPFCVFSELLGMPIGVPGLFEGPFAELVSGQVISVAVGGSGSSVGVGCQVVQFCDAIMRALGHVVLLTCSMQAGRVRVIGMIEWCWDKRIDSVRAYSLRNEFSPSRLILILKQPVAC
jgi:hypothetical protein